MRRRPMGALLPYTQAFSNGFGTSPLSSAIGMNANALE